MPQKRREPQRSEPTEKELRLLEQRVHQLVNTQRQRAKLPPLGWREDVARAARDHSKNMAERNFFDHTDPRLGDVDKRLNRFRIPWRACGENIFMLHGYENPAQVAVQGWMSS
ncbi:MAG: CAP domain-containing protein, partial [Fimbriimonadales bacterium]|nr:CAP domain-containing protein [Fimbriimonadales bacterium]